MTKISDIYAYLCHLAPLDLQMDFDNSGIQLGRINSKVTKTLLALDITDDVVDEAISAGVELIISHHPLIFTPLKNVCDEKILRLIENQIAVISMHTNLDIANGGVNDVLLNMLGAEFESELDSDGCGRVGIYKNPIKFEEFLCKCKDVLKSKGLRFYNSGREIKRIAVMGGSGGNALYAAAEKNCDLYLTSDIKYNQFLDACSLGISLVDGDHFCTENLIIPELAAKLSDNFDNVEFIVSERHCQIIEFA